MRKLVVLTIVLYLCVSNIVFSDTNIDIGIGEGTGLGNKDNYWLEGWYGVRVSLLMKTKSGWKDVNVVDIAAPSAPVGQVEIHFGKHSKVEYVLGNRELKILEAVDEQYEVYNSSLSIPVLFSASGVGSKEEIKTYFSNEKVSDSIANILTEGRTINGKALAEYFNAKPERFRIVIEPILYCVYRGKTIAGTPTQWAFFHNFLNKGKENANSHLRERLYIVTHLNAPLSMYLERSELGISAPSAGETTATLIASWGNSGLPDMLIFKKLGVGMMSKSKAETLPIVIEETYDYLCNRYVITSVTIKDSVGDGYDIENPAWVEFTVGGQTYRHDNIYIPPGGSALAWLKWKTPKSPGTVGIEVSSNTLAEDDEINITARIAKLSATLPPDPEAEDRNDNFNYGIKPPNPPTGGTESNSWTVYDCKWQANLVLEEVDNPNYNVSVPKGDPKYDDRKKIKDWVDKGSYLFTPVTYTATLKGGLKITPDDRVPTAEGKRMGSGYGFNAVLNARIATAAPDSAITKVQTCVVYFPEFHYKTYTRIMEMEKGKLQLPVNIFSHFDRRVHFTPVWFRDGDYVVYAEVSDAWTPAGQLKYSYTDTLEIKGSVYDDWRVVPIRER